MNVRIFACACCGIICIMWYCLQDLSCHVIHIKNLDGGMHYYQALMIIGTQGTTPRSESLGATSETSSSASESGT